MKILEFRDFSKTYKGGKRAVDSLSLSVEAGDICGFIGHNGAGKTTAIRAAVGVLDFSEGDIFICGGSVRKNPVECKAVTAYIPDNPDIYEHLTGIQYLNFIGDVYGVTAAERSERLEMLGKRFELTANLGDLVSSYSHGMRQKLALISAFLHSPRLLVLDEPFVGLDPKAALELKNLMHEFCASGGAVFFSTHVLEVAERLCNKIAIIKNGRLIASGDTESVRGDSSLEELFMELLEGKDVQS